MPVSDSALSPHPPSWPVLRRLLTQRRGTANRALASLLDAERSHIGKSGPRERLGQWIDRVPVGREATTYAQSDVWRHEGLCRLRSARVSEESAHAHLHHPAGRSDAMHTLAEAAEAYDVAQQLISGATDLLHGIAARDRARKPPPLG